MRIGRTFGIFVTCVAATLPIATLANAKCTRLAFSVNDYGKEGPTRDAKVMLDKYIAKWTADRGIKSYQTGPKSVTCELFLDFVVFDEHTCKAEASVCWADASVNGQTPPLADGSTTVPAVAKPQTKTAATPAEPAQVPAPPVATLRSVTPADVAPSPTSKAAEAKPEAAPVTTGSVGTNSGGAVVPPLEPDTPTP